MIIKGQQLIDKFGRIHDYLRISVTDHCNLRCKYCRPEEPIKLLENNQVLHYEEIEEIVKVAASLGVKGIRLTGGEPLIRRNIEKLVEILANITGIEDISLTTNGIYLAEKARTLKKAGLSRVNISLDSCNPILYRQITRGGNVKQVLHAIDASIEVGFNPVKLNVVLIKGFNDHEIDDFLLMTLNRPIHVRFIEYMPIGGASDKWKSHYMPLTSVMERSIALGLPAKVTKKVSGNGPSDNYTLPNGKGSFGLIHPVSHHFCNNCNRLRLTADGNLKPCLYWDDEYNVREYIGDKEKMEKLFLKVINLKPEKHEMVSNFMGEKSDHRPTVRYMSQIGG